MIRGLKLERWGIFGFFLLMLGCGAAQTPRPAPGVHAPTKTHNNTKRSGVALAFGWADDSRILAAVDGVRAEFPRLEMLVLPELLLLTHEGPLLRNRLDQAVERVTSAILTSERSSETSALLGDAVRKDTLSGAPRHYFGNEVDVAVETLTGANELQTTILSDAEVFGALVRVQSVREAENALCSLRRRGRKDAYVLPQRGRLWVGAESHANRESAERLLVELAVATTMRCDNNTSPNIEAAALHWLASSGDFAPAFHVYFRSPKPSRLPKWLEKSKEVASELARQLAAPSQIATLPLAHAPVNSFAIEIDRALDAEAAQLAGRAALALEATAEECRIRRFSVTSFARGTTLGWAGQAESDEELAATVDCLLDAEVSTLALGRARRFLQRDVVSEEILDRLGQRLFPTNPSVFNPWGTEASRAASSRAGLLKEVARLRQIRWQLRRNDKSTQSIRRLSLQRINSPPISCATEVRSLPFAFTTRSILQEDYSAIVVEGATSRDVRRLLANERITAFWHYEQNGSAAAAWHGQLDEDQLRRIQSNWSRSKELAPVLLLQPSAARAWLAKPETSAARVRGFSTQVR